MLAAFLVAAAPPPREWSEPLGPAMISLFTNPDQRDSPAQQEAPPVTTQQAQLECCERGFSCCEGPFRQKKPGSASQQDALAAAEINVAFGSAEGGKCFSLFWQRAHRISSHQDFRSQVKTGKSRGSGYLPSQAGKAWAYLRRRDAQKYDSKHSATWNAKHNAEARVAYRTANPTRRVPRVDPVSCPSFGGNSNVDAWCEFNCLGSTPTNCPSDVCNCPAYWTEDSLSPKADTATARDAARQAERDVSRGGDNDGDSSLPARSDKAAERAAVRQAARDVSNAARQVARNDNQIDNDDDSNQPQESDKAAARATVRQAAHDGVWSVEEHTNCYNGYGAKVPQLLRGLHTENSSLEDCKTSCFETPRCEVIVVQGPIHHEGWLREGTGDVTVSCWLHEEVDLNKCLGDSQGSAVFTLNREGEHELRGRHSPTSAKEQRPRASPTSTKEHSYVPEDASTCISILFSATDAWCAAVCAAGSCALGMCVCDADAKLVREKETSSEKPSVSQASPDSTEECSHLLPVNVSDVVVTTGETDAAEKQKPQLDAMRRRAEVLKTCKAADRWSRPADGAGVQPLQLRGDPDLAASKSEVIVCPGAKLAFIHVYKAAGTTIIASLHDLCQSVGSQARLICGHDNEKSWPVLEGDDGMWCDQTLAEAWDDISDYTWFTFVRDPVERFKSGLFENAYRASTSNYTTCAGQAGNSKEGIEGDELALAVLDRCLRWLEPDSDLLDPHLKPQIDFFLQSDQSVMPRLAYIGHVEMLADDWPALVSEFFGAKASAQVRRVLQNDALHVRSEASDQYSVGGLDPKFYNLEMGDSTKKIIADAFLVDGVCLGYSTG